MVIVTVLAYLCTRGVEENDRAARGRQAAISVVRLGAAPYHVITASLWAPPHK